MDNITTELYNELLKDKSEIYRYLGYCLGHETGPVSELNPITDEVLEQLCSRSTPHSTSKCLLLETDGSRCIFRLPENSSAEPLVIASKALSHHLSGCREALFFSATIGPGVDMLIRRYSEISMIKLALVQAAGAALIEAYADRAVEELKKTYPYLKPRFSPGYGDFSLSHQTDFFRILRLGETLGLSLNDAYLMTPSKSITAVIGISDSEDSCAASKCAVCPNTACEFRHV